MRRLTSVGVDLVAAVATSGACTPVRRMGSSTASSAFDSAPGASVAEGNSFSELLEKEKAKEAGNAAHPLLYNVPALSARTVGRDAEVTSLWQKLLSGRRCQVLVGVDGIGKSTIASEFCDAARKSGRFTCIQWFNGQHALESQLERFFASMRGRKEKSVLLVLDDVAKPEETVRLLPEHKNVYVILTSSSSGVAQSTKLSVSPTLPLQPQAAEELAVEVDGAEAADTVKEVLDLLGFVPLLVNIASLLMAGGVVSSKELSQALQEKSVMESNTLSISKALDVLLDFAVRELAKKWPDARRELAQLSCFHLSDISDSVIASVCGDAGAQMAVTAAQLGILSLKWEDSAFALHPAVAAVLRDDLAETDLPAAATALRELWPRRWRGMGSHLAYNLVWHAYALSGHFSARGVAFTEDLVACMDRSATFLAHNEARDLAVAADLWYAIFEQQQRVNQGSGVVAVPTAESVRVARECGRLLHFLRDERAADVLAAAFAGAVAVHSAEAAETALVMGCYAPYLPATPTSLEQLARCSEVLEVRLGSTDLVLSKEETKMLLETQFVLLVCRGQIMEEMGEPVADDLYNALDGVKARLRQCTR